MDKKVAIGIAIGVASVAAGAALTAAAIAVTKKVTKIANEMENDKEEQTFTSPDGNNTVTLSYGSSESANGLTHIRVTATSEGKEDDCTLVAFARKSTRMFEGEWIDNDHFKLLIGCTNRKQCCDVSFDGEQITAHYYLCKVTAGE